MQTRCKQIRKARRREPKQPRIGHDDAVLARDGQGLPMRIDDETEGIPLLSPAGGCPRRRAHSVVSGAAAAPPRLT
jgi:hypothetical protein